MQKKTYFFFGNRGSQKEGGGPTFGKNSQKIPFFWGVASLSVVIPVEEFSRLGLEKFCPNNCFVQQLLLCYSNPSLNQAVYVSKSINQSHTEKVS